jgi:hypothetical protein
MFSDLLNYFVIPTVFSFGAFGLFYFLNPDKANDLLKDIAWQSVNVYSKASIYFENLAQAATIEEEEEYNDDFEEVKPLLSYYNYDEDLVIHMGNDYENLPNEWWEDNEKNVDLIILNKQDDKELFKTFKNFKTLSKSDKTDWTTVEKQFVQIEFVQNDTCIDIHKHLNSFYLAKNVLFTPAFVKWYLKNWFNTTLKDDAYTLKIFDKDVNLFSLTKEQYIKITKDGYEIKNINEESEDEESEDEDSENDDSENEDNDSQYEGAQDD